MMNNKMRYAAAFLASVICLCSLGISFKTSALSESAEYDSYGGGYAATNQLPDFGYTTEEYNAANGLPTSDAMFLMGASDGHMWIGGNSGVFCYDGSNFERMYPTEGMTNARGFFEDSTGRIWVGTNDNGVVVKDKNNVFHLTYKDGLPSYSIRIFAEDNDGNVFIGTTAGICYADRSLKIHDIQCDDISNERVLKLDSDSEGKIYGQTSNGIIFKIEGLKVTASYRSEDLGMEKITTIMADKKLSGQVYIGTEDGFIYRGKFGDRIQHMKKTDASELNGSIHWLNYDCGRVWASSKNAVGYLGEGDRFHLLEHIPFNSGIEMTDSDYQGNIWIASSTQGVMKLVTNNFVDLTSEAGLPEEVGNAVCFFGSDLYIGTDNGLRIIDKYGNIKENELTDYIGKSKIRCFAEDKEGNLWIASYTEELGLICCSKNGSVRSFTTVNGMPSNQVRCVYIAGDGSVIAGTDGGIAVIRDDKVSQTFGISEGMSNTVILSVSETDDGNIMAGSDGDGIYIIKNDKLSKIGRNDGLTSDVIRNIIKDDKNNIFWFITSNSIEYMKDGKIKNISTFPYNSNYDIFFDENGNAWVLSSCGIYVISASDMLSDKIEDYSLYTIENGLPFAITSTSCSTSDDEGNLYIAGRNGIIKVNMNRFYETHTSVLTGISSVYCDDNRVYPDGKGVYHIPASRGRIQIMASVMDYTLQNHMVRVFLENEPESGITVLRSHLSELEYTNLPYGEYTLHVQIVDIANGNVFQDDTFKIDKAARISELLTVKIIFLLLFALFAGFIVWHFMQSTVVARQYDEIRQAKEEAERANTAKSRFLANISHEIRTPINTVMGMNEMIMRENASGVRKEYFIAVMSYALDIRKASESLLVMIDGLLDISKIESGKMQIVEQEYDVQELLRSLISINRIRSSEKGLKFDIFIDEMLPRRLFGDDGKIRQIIMNFLTNAVKYTNVGGIQLSVSMEERDGKTAIILFSVKDTGIGIKETDMDKLFTAYERLDEKINRNVQGIGLGLDISRRFAELMNGSINCKSVYTEGSEFTFKLSQKIADDTPIGTFTENAENIIGGKYIPQFIAPDADILLVDDNPTSLHLIKELLRETRVFVTTAKSGEDALELIKESHFDVVFLDLVMPGIDGLEVIEKIREYDTELPVYAMTANAADGENFYKANGFTGFLSKPVDGLLLEKTIMRHLPEKMLEYPQRQSQNPEITELPEQLQWLYDVPEISVEDGIKNSLGIKPFIFSLKMFFDTIEEFTGSVRKAYESGDIRYFTVKVHALYVSSNLIGALGLADLAGKMEKAIKQRDTEYIIKNTEELLSEYESLREKLSDIDKTDDPSQGKE